MQLMGIASLHPSYALYCEFISESMAAIIKDNVSDTKCERFSMPNAPEGVDQVTKFFSRGPESLEALRNALRRA